MASRTRTPANGLAYAPPSAVAQRAMNAALGGLVIPEQPPTSTSSSSSSCVPVDPGLVGVTSASSFSTDLQRDDDMEEQPNILIRQLPTRPRRPPQWLNDYEMRTPTQPRPKRRLVISEDPVPSGAASAIVSIFSNTSNQHLLL